MTLKHDLLERGFFPEGLPPPFNTDLVARYFSPSSTGYLSPQGGVRPATYNASKRGLSRRTFSVIHPVTAYDLAHFLDGNAEHFGRFFGASSLSLSVPRHTPDGERAVVVGAHSELEEERLNRLSGHRFIAKTDISRFYHSIYTHSIPWAFHGKEASKNDRAANSRTVFFNRLDYILRQGQDGQTIGIPVGPDASRYVAELVATAVDRTWVRRCGALKLSVIRHVDDVWIGADTHAAAEEGLWRYREALREFELDINENKTKIYAEGFSFSDTWPSEIATRLESAIGTTGKRKAERLRAALEYAFANSVSEGDEGVLKYTIRQIDRWSAYVDTWGAVEPFLMRTATHFGHTIDFVARIVIWRELTGGTLDIPRWTEIFLSVLDRHGRLGNDSEVCWSLFAALRLRISIPEPIAANIIRNCGALSVVMLLNCQSADLVSESIYGSAFDLLSSGSDSGPMWPLYLEWRAKKWPRWRELPDASPDETVLDMAHHDVTIFDADRLPLVFEGVEPSDFGDVTSAIEAQTGSYESEGEGEDE